MLPVVFFSDLKEHDRMYSARLGRKLSTGTRYGIFVALVIKAKDGGEAAKSPNPAVFELLDRSHF